MVKILQSKAGKIIISILVLLIAGVLGDLAFIGFTTILNGTAEASDKTYTLIYSLIFVILFGGLFLIKKWYDLKWARRLFIVAPIILTLFILIGGALIFTFH